MLRRRAVTEGHADQLDSAGDGVRTIVRHCYHRLAILIPVLDIVDRVTQCTGGAFLDRFDNVLDTRGIGVDPRVPAKPEYRLQAVRAEAGMSTDSTVVVNGDAPARIVHTVIPSVVSDCLIREPVRSVCSVTERLVPGAAAAAQRHALNSRRSEER